MTDAKKTAEEICPKEIVTIQCIDGGSIRPAFVRSLIAEALIRAKVEGMREALVIVATYDDFDGAISTACKDIREASEKLERGEV